MTSSEIFDRRRRRARRARAFGGGEPDFVRAVMIEELLERLGAVKRSFGRALDLGAGDGALTAALRARGIAVVTADAGARADVRCDEDRLPFADASFDLVVSAGALDTVNDLPGALTLARRVLKPDGLLLAALLGAPSLGALKAASLAADLATGGAAQARAHPQIDVRAGGDLLARAGFAMPVADTLTLTARYGDLSALVRDLRAMAAGNLLTSGARPVTRDWLGEAASAFAARADAGGKTPERFELLFLTGWKPG